MRSAGCEETPAPAVAVFFRASCSKFCDQMLVRLQKFLADAGVASRRAGEQIILAGRVEVNGNRIRQLGAKVDPACDRVTVDGKPVKEKRKLYIALNKP